MLAKISRLIRSPLLYARRALKAENGIPRPCQTDLTAITQFEDEDVFIVAYPKSGNTWSQNLMAGLAYGVLPQFAPDTLIQDLVPDVYRTSYKRYGTPTLFKSHELPLPQYKRVVYLLRDGRDVMVSYYHHLVALGDNKGDFLHTVQSGEGLFPCKWHQHVEAWLSNPYGAKMITVTYENLLANPVTELRKVCDFIGYARGNAFLERVAEGASFQNMRMKEVTSGWADPNWPKDKPFVRRGKAGSHRDEMPSAVLQAFLNEAGPILSKMGYE